MRRENRFLFTSQKLCRFHRDEAEDLILGVDQPPLAVDLTGFGGKRFHRRLKKGTETTGQAPHCQPMESGAIRALKVLYGNYNAPQYSCCRYTPFFSQFPSRKGACSFARIRTGFGRERDS